MPKAYKMRSMPPRRKLVIVVSAEVVALLALVAFFAGVLLRAPAPGALPGLVTAASPPSPGPSSTAPAVSTRPATSPTWTPLAAVLTAPPATATLAPSATLTPVVTGQVIASGGGLRLRQS